MGAPLGSHDVGHGSDPPSSDGVAQDADALDLELDHVTLREPAVELEPRAAGRRTRAPPPPGAPATDPDPGPAGRRTRAEDLARVEREAAGGVGDHVGERVV